MLAAAAMGTVMLALPAPPSSAQQPAAAALGEAQVLTGGEWAIGRWEGHLLHVGTSAGTMGMTKEPRLFLIDKDANGKVTCRFVSIPASLGSYPPSTAIPATAGLTKRCVLGPNGISLTAANSAQLELNRSGPDGLQGTSKPPTNRPQTAAGLGGIEVHCPSSDHLRQVWPIWKRELGASVEQVKRPVWRASSVCFEWSVV